MLSIGPLTDLRPETLRPSTTWSFKRRSIWDWRTAGNCASIPRWSKPTFIIRPTTRCSGMWCASSRGSSSRLGERASPRNRGLYQPHTPRAASDAGDPAHDARGSATAATTQISRPHRHRRAGRRKMREGAREDRKVRGSRSAGRHGHRGASKADRALLRAGRPRHRSGRRRVLEGRAGCQPRRRSTRSSSPIPI